MLPQKLPLSIRYILPWQQQQQQQQQFQQQELEQQQQKLQKVYLFVSGK